MMTPKVSVVMASYNHAAFVHEAIGSVLAQSYQDFELVITDDGSGDGTADVVRAVADPRIRLNAFTKNQGAGAAMNDAITRARGEYIAVLNSDDCFLPGKLQRQVDFLEAHPGIGAVFGLPQFVDEQGRLFQERRHAFFGVFVDTNRSRQEWLRYFFQKGNCLCHPTIMVRKSCYKKAGLLDPLLMQLPDLDLWVRLCAAYDIHVLPEKVTAFRILGQERNVSAPSEAKLARLAWEIPAVLAHYALLPEQTLREIFPEGDPAHPARMVLALAALQVRRPGYVQFGLGLLQECLRQDSGSFSRAEYFRLVGEADPYAAGFAGGEYRMLKKSRLPAIARQVVLGWRSLTSRG